MRNKDRERQRCDDGRRFANTTVSVDGPEWIGENKGNESKKEPSGYGSLPLEIIVCERGLVAFYRHTESRDCGRERERKGSTAEWC